jgi:RHS repeat-associated protein
MQMQLSSGTPIPDGLLAAIVLRNEKPRLGVPSRNPALHQGIDAANSTIVLGLQSTAALNRIGSRCTGKERDTETGLDYFGARYFSSNSGRWVSPDWSATFAPVPYAKLDHPQSLNLYAYVGNNPLTTVDADGHHLTCNPSESSCQKNTKENAENDRKLSLWAHIKNLAHLRPWNYEPPPVRTTVTTEQGEGMVEREADPAITGLTDAVSLSGIVIKPKFPLVVGSANAAGSIANDPHNKLNTGIQLLGLFEEFAPQMAITGAFIDGFDYGAKNSHGTVTDTWKGDQGPFLGPYPSADDSNVVLPISTQAGSSPMNTDECKLSGDC